MPRIRRTILFFPQRGRVSAQLTGEGEKSGSPAIGKASPSSAPVCRRALLGYGAASPGKSKRGSQTPFGRFNEGGSREGEKPEIFPSLVSFSLVPFFWTSKRKVRPVPRRDPSLREAMTALRAVRAAGGGGPYGGMGAFCVGAAACPRPAANRAVNENRAANSQNARIRRTILFFPQRGRMSAQLTGEGEKRGSPAIVSASPSSVIRRA